MDDVANPELLRVVSREQGIGPLFQRDYWGVIEGCRASPPELIDQVVAHFAELTPSQLVSFARLDGSAEKLSVGDDLNVTIAGAGTFGVRVVHRGPQSFTFATLSGHPEAGRITFGAYRNDHDDVIFHIRSRARSSSRKFAWGYAVVGEAMQTNVWTDFIWAVASAFGTGVRGAIHAETQRLDSLSATEVGDLSSPTFVAQGG
jgi:hypothetical protein